MRIKLRFIVDKLRVLAVLMMLAAPVILIVNTASAAGVQTVANVIVFAKFKNSTAQSANLLNDDTNWENVRQNYNSLDAVSIPNLAPADISFKNYINMVSNGHVSVENYFPQDDGARILVHEFGGEYENYINGDEMIREIIQGVNNSNIPFNVGSAKLDNVEGGVIDNLTLIVEGEGGTNRQGIIYARKGNYSGMEKMRGLSVASFNILPSDAVLPLGRSSVGTMAHEFLHTLGFADLYYSCGCGTPVGAWDIMGVSAPNYPLTYTRAEKGWLNKNYITRSGTYTLTATTEAGEDGKMFVIDTPLKTTEHIVLEFRRKGDYGRFDFNIPYTGLLMYRVNDTVEGHSNFPGAGESSGNYIYVYRSGVTDLETEGRPSITGTAGNVALTTDPDLNRGIDRTSYGSTDLDAAFTSGTLYYSDGQNSGVRISNIRISNDEKQVTFDVELADYSTYNYWEDLGSMTNSNLYTPTLYSGSDATYAAFSEGATMNSAKVMVKKYSGNWTNVGGAISGLHSPSLVEMGGKMYLAGIAATTSSDVNYYRLDGSNWTKIGSVGNAYANSVQLVTDGSSIYTLYSSSDKLVLKNISSGQVVFEKMAGYFSNPTAAISGGKLYLVYSDFFGGDKRGRVESYNLSSGIWNTEVISSISPSNVHHIVTDGGKVYALIGGDNVSPEFYSFDGTSWSAAKTVAQMTSYLNTSLSVIAGVPFVSYTDTGSSKNYVLDVSGAITVKNETLGSEYSYATVQGSRDYFYALVQLKNSSTLMAKRIASEVDNGPMGEPEGGNESHILYKSHVQNDGWQGYVKDGALSGTSGRSLRLEGINIKLDSQYSGDVVYATHVQDIGWQSEVSNNALSGTTGRSLRLEAITIKLTGEIAEHYDVYYRTHVEDFGWLDWAKNGEAAGSAGYSKRMEAIEIRLVKKGEAAPGTTANHYKDWYTTPIISYQTHVQNVGWQGYVSNGAGSGTSGQSLRLEGIRIKLSNLPCNGGISYSTHVEGIGWQDEVSNNALAGTTGMSRRLEAIKIQLTGEMAEKYNVKYRVHVQDIGWMNWVENGAVAGTTGRSLRLEAIEIMLVEK